MYFNIFSFVMNLLEDTIAAIATPYGVGAISVIRISGPASIAITDTVFAASSQKKLAEAPSHTIHYGNIIDRNGDVLDDVLVSVFKAPHSFTGEESVEISTHGNPLICQNLLSLLTEKGARLAEPGEFTRRAYINGRLDLAQAEAVAAVISARTDASLKGARNQLDGLLSREVAALRDKLVNSASLVELELDFAEEDLEFVDKTGLTALISEIVNSLDNLLKTYRFGKVLREGINVAIVGKPNVGKSSLLNYLVKEYRAIVSEIPGTTRDIIREEVTIDGYLYIFHDTAGIRDSADVIELEGVRRSRSAIADADLILFLSDVTQGIDKSLFDELIALGDSGKIVSVINKVDIHPQHKVTGDVYISAKTGVGIADLFRILREKAVGSSVYTEKNALVSSLRHFNALSEAKNHLLNSLDSVSAHLSGEFQAVDLRRAVNSLSEVIGEVTSDDILNNIFQKFCIGK